MENRLFGCCNLRRGSIVFAWIQMMMIVMIIAALIAVLDISQTEANSNPKHDHAYVAALVKIGIAAYSIKALTVVSLTWGLVKRKHLFYQPWIFISFIELIIQFISLLAHFSAIFTDATSVSYFIGSGLTTALNCYIFYCVCTVYNADKDGNPTTIRFDEEYNPVSVKDKTYLMN